MADEDKTYSDWLDEMKGWSPEQIDKVILENKAPVARVEAAREHKIAMSGGVTSAGSPLSSGALTRIVDRLEGKPKDGSKVVIGVFQQHFHGTTEEMLGQIETYLTVDGERPLRIGGPTPAGDGETPPAELRKVLPRQRDREADSEDPAGERTDPPGDAEDCGGESSDPG